MKAARGTLVFDGDCGFCTSSVRAMARLHIRAASVIAWQHADLGALALTPEQCTEKLQWIADDGSHASGHEAVAALLRANRPWAPLGHALLLPGISWLAAGAYSWIAAHRMSLPGGTPACALASQAPLPGADPQGQ
ncbi:MAG: hypothetical protein JWO22_757 [Frankiales bacterium]|nr:hypothetical protein [Frankiales bacterium]